MNFTFEMIVNALEVTLILDFLVRYFGWNRTSSVKYWGTALIWLISFVNISFFSWTHLYESYASSLQILINFVFCCLLLRGTLFQKVFLSAFTMGLVAIIATFVTLLIAKVSSNPVTELLSQLSAVRFTAILLTKLLFFLITRLILRVKENGEIRLTDFIPLIIIPALSIIVITLLMYAAIQEPFMQNIIFYAAGIVLLLNMVVYFLFVRIGQAEQMKTEMALLSLQNECMQERSKDIENMYENVRALRHDMKNHLLSISSMAKTGDTDEIQRYAAELLREQSTNDRLVMFSGNHALDAIISSKSAAAKRAGVQLRAVVTTSLTEFPPEDIVVIIGNVLDNAIRAAQESSRKTVDLHIQPQGAYSSILVANDVLKPVLTENPELNTTKKARMRHGFGIQNMRKAVERNQGMMRFYESNNRFVCDILLLNLPTMPE